jgi:hypothetical protein
MKNLDLGIQYESVTLCINARACGCMANPRTLHFLQKLFEMGSACADPKAHDVGEYSGSAEHCFYRSAH